jgi:hypothetical protein
VLFNDFILKINLIGVIKNVLDNKDIFRQDVLGQHEYDSIFGYSHVLF